MDPLGGLGRYCFILFGLFRGCLGGLAKASRLRARHSAFKGLGTKEFAGFALYFAFLFGLHGMRSSVIPTASSSHSVQTQRRRTGC